MGLCTASSCPKHSTHWVYTFLRFIDNHQVRAFAHSQLHTRNHHTHYEDLVLGLIVNITGSAPCFVVMYALFCDTTM